MLARLPAYYLKITTHTASPYNVHYCSMMYYIHFPTDCGYLHGARNSGGTPSWQVGVEAKAQPKTPRGGNRGGGQDNYL